MTSKRLPEGWPTTFGPEVTVQDIDLDKEEFVVGGRRLTTERANELAEHAERRSGRPSLSGGRRHSPALNLRVSQTDRDRLDEVAAAQGRRASDVARDALREYLERHAS
ncbi:CopG family transcriptional regulator [Propionimicrobium sp. PCR01-08-3]|uniref:CopG family transcriptional regulator n=1 Tax=Propionimicrobium sp. PCR01-08-3 TaxID=3052086 RepID=UPI00255CA5D9|nr:CopG family transcriptional regulator [Propionimicrobium sp. PCR01-08-3]WIY83002.1 CopG family transcriptional regulator [Propionimicrobium sp. PCR01-08-3]